jgi:hypothetical protein
LVDDYIGIAMLNKKVKDAEKAKQRQAAAEAGQQGLDQTIVDQIRAKAAMLGIDNAQSNLPEFTAFDGGIVAMAGGGALNDMTNEMTYADGGEIDSDGVARFQAGGRSAFMEDVDRFRNYAKEPGINEAIIKRMREFGSYFTKPRQAPTDADAQPGGLYGSGSNVPPVAPPKPPEIEIGPRKEVQPPRDDKMDEGTMAGFDPSGKGIDEIIANVTKSLDAQAAARKQDKKEAGATRLIEAGLGMMAGTSPFAGVNIGQGVTPAVRGYGEDIRQYRQDEAKDIGQRAALGLKGYEAKTDLAKLGIMAPLYKAQADYYGRKPGSAGSLGLGSVPPATADKIITRYEGYGADPKSAPFFSSLPKDVQEGLTKYKPGTESYNRSMEQFKRFSEQHMNRYLNGLRTLSAKSRPDEE